MITDWFEVIDPRFRLLILPNVHVDTLFTGGRWLEGPLYVPAARCVLFSDIPNNRVMRWDEIAETVTTFRAPSDYANGRALDALGRVITCEHRSRSVTRTEHDGTVTVLADSFAGKRLNSPNDVIAMPDGSVWFTDPTYGISTEYEGAQAEAEIGSRNVFRISPEGDIDAAIADLDQPNGLALSPDGRTLYVADSGSQPSRLLAYTIDNGRVGEGPRVVSECTSGIFDGLKVDRRGMIWAAAPDGVHCLAPDGTLLGKIRIPETVANLCFGGLAGNRLFICATRGLYHVYVNTTARLLPSIEKA